MFLVMLILLLLLGLLHKMGYYTKENRKRKILGYKNLDVKNQKCSAKRISDIFEPGMLENVRCFIIAGGPSVKNLDFSLLENEFTIGINKSFLKFNTDICYMMDWSLYRYVSYPGVKQEQKEINEIWINYKGYKVFLCPREKRRFEKDVYIVDRASERKLNKDFKQGIFPGRNSGLGAIMLAILLGSTEIYLLGYDLKISKKETHWHNGYAYQDATSFSKRLDMFKKEFEVLSKDVEEQNISVVNLNPESTLECFPKDTLDNVLNNVKKDVFRAALV